MAAKLAVVGTRGPDWSLAHDCDTNAFNLGHVMCNGRHKHLSQCPYFPFSRVNYVCDTDDVRTSGIHTGPVLAARFYLFVLGPCLLLF